MTNTYDTSNNIGKVRLLIPDRNLDDDSVAFSDEELDVFLNEVGDNIYYAAAMALEVVAADQAMLLKVMRIDSLSLDGSKVAQILMERASDLRKQGKLMNSASYAIAQLTTTSSDTYYDPTIGKP